MQRLLLGHLLLWLEMVKILEPIKKVIFIHLK